MSLESSRAVSLQKRIPARTLTFISFALCFASTVEKLVVYESSVALSQPVLQQPQRTIDYNTSNFRKVLITPNAGRATGSYIGADRHYTCELSQGNNVTLRKSPDCIIAGTHKGVTSALYALLHEHPNVFRSAPNPEPHLFDYRSISRTSEY
jgi:hypothetical protein